MKLQRHRRTGLLYRPGTNDPAILGEQGCYGALGVGLGDVVLDCGAHIAAFALESLRRGAVRVVLVEPCRENRELAKRNLAGHARAGVFAFAVVGTADGRTPTPATIDLHLSRTKDKSCHSTVPRRGRKRRRRVQAISDRELFSREPWTVIKIDIEGEELHIDFTALPPTARALAVEFHAGAGWLEAAAERISEIEGLGFEAVRPPVLKPNQWNTVGIWRREPGA